MIEDPYVNEIGKCKRINFFWSAHFSDVIDSISKGVIDIIIGDQKEALLLRDEIIDSRALPRILADLQIEKQHESIACFLWYACKHPSRKKRISMNVDKMVELWAELIPKFSLGHDKNELDQAEGLLDDSFAPFLIAPIKELREFFGKLVERLKNDPKIPYIVWRTYEQWYEMVIKSAKDQEIKVLKEDLAKKIVALVDPERQEVKQDIRDAMVDALMWRSEKQLENVKTALESGSGKPRVKGRQSCLYLQVHAEGQENPMVEVML